jgi:hypothetical protein
MRANIVKNLANSPLSPSVLALLARTLILNLYRLELIEVPLKAGNNMHSAIKQMLDQYHCQS